jgi:hypothetical protein
MLDLVNFEYVRIYYSLNEILRNGLHECTLQIQRDKSVFASDFSGMETSFWEGFGRQYVYHLYIEKTTNFP